MSGFRTLFCEIQLLLFSRSVVSDSLRPHGLQPTRHLHPWDFPGKSTRVGCHCLLHPKALQTIHRLAIEPFFPPLSSFLWTKYLIGSFRTPNVHYMLGNCPQNSFNGNYQWKNLKGRETLIPPVILLFTKQHCWHFLKKKKKFKPTRKIRQHLDYHTQITSNYGKMCLPVPRAILAIY